MVEKIMLTEQTAAGYLLILSSILFLPGGLFFTARMIFKWEVAQTRNFLIWERVFVMAAILVAALGLTILAKLLEMAGDGVFSSIGMTIFLVGTILMFIVETLYLGKNEWVYPLVVVSIVLVFLGESAFGVSILRSGFLQGWVGWTTIIWNLAWLVILPIARPKNIYYPWLFYVAPLVIGIVLLRS